MGPVREKSQKKNWRNHSRPNPPLTGRREKDRERQAKGTQMTVSRHTAVEGRAAVCAASSCAQISLHSTKGAVSPVNRPARLPSRDSMKPRAMEPSSFAGKGMDAHAAGWRRRRCDVRRQLTALLRLRLHPSTPAHWPSLDCLDIISWVQANQSVIQAPLAPALLILIFYLGQLVPCKTQRGCPGEQAGGTLASGPESPSGPSPHPGPTEGL